MSARTRRVSPNSKVAHACIGVGGMMGSTDLGNFKSHDRTQIVASYIFTQAFKRLDFGYASAIALVLLILLLVYSMLIVLLRQTLLNKG